MKRTLCRNNISFYVVQNASATKSEFIALLQFTKISGYLIFWIVPSLNSSLSVLNIRGLFFKVLDEPRANTPWAEHAFIIQVAY